MVEGKKRHRQEWGDLPRLYRSKENSGFFTDHLQVYLLIEARTHLRKFNILFKSHKMCEPNFLCKF